MEVSKRTFKYNTQCTTSPNGKYIAYIYENLVNFVESEYLEVNKKSLKI
jgi:hypothetical protein